MVIQDCEIIGKIRLTSGAAARLRGLALKDEIGGKAALRQENEVVVISRSHGLGCVRAGENRDALNFAGLGAEKFFEVIKEIDFFFVPPAPIGLSAPSDDPFISAVEGTGELRPNR